jgi:L-iditol 2-dehydrogenase
MTETMRAGRLVELGRVVVDEVPIDPPRDGELLVRSQFSSICGSDLHDVEYGIGLPPPPWPAGWPGHEGIGEVVESKAAGFAPGDLVLCVPFAPLGRTMAEFQRCAAATAVALDRGAIAKVEHALMAQQLGTVIFALRQFPVDVAGRTVVVLGQGSAGLFFCNLLRRAGAGRIVVADLSDSRLAVSSRYGADVTLNAARDDVGAAVADLTKGRGADYVIEAVGRRDTLAQSIDLAAVDSPLLWFGLPDTDQAVPINFNKFFRKRLRTGSTYGAQGEPGLTSFRVAAAMIARGEIDVSPLLTHVLPIEDVERAFELAMSRDEGAVKVSVSF